MIIGSRTQSHQSLHNEMHSLQWMISPWPSLWSVSDPFVCLAATHAVGCLREEYCPVAFGKLKNNWQSIRLKCSSTHRSGDNELNNITSDWQRLLNWWNQCLLKKLLLSPHARWHHHWLIESNVLHSILLHAAGVLVRPIGLTTGSWPLASNIGQKIWSHNAIQQSIQW